MLAYIPVNLANIIVSFGTVVILTRLLSAEEFGRYAVAIITMHFAHTMMFTWIEGAMARFQARAERENSVATHLKTLYLMAVGMCFIAAILYAAIIIFAPLPDTLKTVIAFAIGSTCVSVFINIGMEAHKAAHRIKRYSISFSTQTILGFAIGIILILATPLRETGPFVGIILGALIVLSVDLLFMIPKLKGGVFDKEKMKTYTVYGIPLSLSLMLTYALNSADVYLIAGLMGEASAGEYNAGYNLANRSLEIIFVWLAMAVTPVAITAFEKNGSDVSQSIMRNYGATLLWITLPAATGIALVAKDAGFIIGESVRDNAVMVMPWIAFAGVLNGFINYYIQRAFMISGATKSFVWVMVPPFVLNIGLNLWLIPIFGLLGAVYATISAYLFGAIIAFIVARKHYPLPLPIKAFFQISVACLIMAGGVLVLPWPENWASPVLLFAKAGWGALIYGVACWVINAAECRSVISDIYARIKPAQLQEAVNE
jgi:O-antigen/teichoic acid export membrane protein